MPDFSGKQINVIETHYTSAWPLSDILFSVCEFFGKHRLYDLVIAFDCDALLRASICLGFHPSKIIYHSLEFYEPTEKTLRSVIKKALERYCARRCRGIFSQDQTRIQYLSNDLRVNIDKFYVVFNSPIGAPICRKEDYFRSQFGIGNDSTIILCIGSLIEEHCVPKLVASIANWPERVVLVLHGWFADKSLRDYVKNYEALLPGRLFVSERLLPHDSKYIPYLSSDIGFVGFDSVLNNIKMAAGSAGKLFDFLRTGVPMLGFNSPGMRDLIEGNKVGFVFDDYSQVPYVISKLIDHRERYRENCFIASQKYDFYTQYSKVLKALSI